MLCQALLLLEAGNLAHQCDLLIRTSAAHVTCCGRPLKVGCRHFFLLITRNPGREVYVHTACSLWQSRYLDVHQIFQDVWTALHATPSASLAPCLPFLARAAATGNAGGQLLAQRLQLCLNSMAALSERLTTYAELNGTTADELRAEPGCQHLVRCPAQVAWLFKSA